MNANDIVKELADISLLFTDQDAVLRLVIEARKLIARELAFCSNCGEQNITGGMGTICKSCIDDMSDNQLSAYLRSLEGS